MTNHTRRAILRGSAVAAAAAAVAVTPALAAIPAPAPASTSGLAALAVRAVELHRADQADWLVHRSLMQEKATPDLLPLVNGDWADATADLWERRSALSRECSIELGQTYEDTDDDEPTESELIDRAMRSTPAATVADVLAKLRWVMGRLDAAILSEAPKLSEAYEWSEGDEAEVMLVSIWGDMERLFGGGEEAEIWRPSIVEKLEEFLQWKRDHPGEAYEKAGAA